MVKVATAHSVKEKLNAILNADWLNYLYERWQDEKEYEDVKDYGKVFSRNTGFPIIRMKKSPLTFVFSHPDIADSIYEIRCTARCNSWRRIA